jgi:hypothetical protein
MNYHRQITYAGKNYFLAELLTEKGLMKNYYAIIRRLERGWNPNRAIDKPINLYGKSLR